MENTSKNFALQLGSLITLYVSTVGLITLLFSVITVLYPDSADNYWEYESATSTIRTSIAVLIVFFPTYIILTRFVNTIRRKEHGVYLTLTKWLIYISLLIGGAVILGDFVAVLISFLNGEITIRFILKALTLLVVVGCAFTYYLLDARSYWQTHEKDSLHYAYATALIVIASIVFGFSHTESPMQVREMRIDTNQISHLQNIQSYIEEYYRLNNKLPQSLTEAFNKMEVPEAPEGRDGYTYQVLTSESFNLCATFAYPSKKDAGFIDAPMGFDGMVLKNPYNWNHTEGEWCFERIVNTEYSKPVAL